MRTLTVLILSLVVTYVASTPVSEEAELKQLLKQLNTYIEHYDDKEVQAKSSEVEARSSNDVRTANAASVPASVCASIVPTERQDCGFPGITRDQCEEKGCCFDDSVRDVKWCFFAPADLGNVKLTTKLGRGVKYTTESLSAVVLSSNIDDAAKFQLVRCLAASKVNSTVRPQCVSLMPADRQVWYVRHYGYYLWLEPLANPRNPGIFDVDSSFIVHPEGSCGAKVFSFESVNFPGYFITVVEDGKLKIAQRSSNSDFCSSATFGINDPIPSSCQEIRNNVANATSGEYTIRTAGRLELRRVYCEMGLNGGGYTFLHPTDLPRLSDSEVQAMFTDKSSFLMRVRKTDGTQPYGILQQLPQYQNVLLKLGLSDAVGYNQPVNLGTLGTPYLYFGFLPVSTAQNRNIQGLRVNGANLTFTNCDSNPNSYIALFPNFAERTPSNYAFGATSPFSDSLLSGSLTLNPSHRVIPDDYFMFLETHWGGCGCYTQTDGRLLPQGIISASIGFR